jgi:hypothetical protein
MRGRLLAVAAAVLVLVIVPGAAAWTWPVDGPVLRPFVFGDDPYLGGQHRGLDVGGGVGDRVRAPAGGRVSFAGTVPGGGRAITIQTDRGWSVTLLQLGSMLVSRGAQVGEGDAVATIGPSSDPATPAPHVHLGIRRTDEQHGYVDPLLLLPARVALPPPAPEEQAAPEPAESTGPEVSTEPVADASPSPREAPAVGAETPARPMSEPVAEPAAETVAEPAAEPLAEPTARSVAEPVARPVAGAASETKATRGWSATVRSVPPRVRAARPATVRPPAYRLERAAAGARASAAVSSVARVARPAEAVAAPSSDPARTAAGSAVESVRPIRHGESERRKLTRALAATEGSTARGRAAVSDRSSASLLALGLGGIAAALAASLAAVRIMGRDVRPEEDPCRSGVAVCERSAPHRARGGVRSPVRHLRAVPPLEGGRRPDGQRDGRAWDAGHGRGRQGGQLAA